ncbi:LLM class flavin-dependent oxidoreductase [Gordonia jinhuaensis]|uniref:Alkane 1-monooxygenase n=1 Tax=Gordonia jinhuaensis TaxID=1517702 RepID=A0A916SVV4_9ACTN|nr:LLM class flavin-dependent oxidoreductase [Gordonia jinhuaensis]GGB19560.1 alkane 1-monooxygenase [Gordonia jinhuaensis]
MSVPYSVLDLSPVVAPAEHDPTDTAPVTTALRNTIELAQATERLGYTRFWLAEHHSMPGIASAATSVMIGQVAAATSTIRVGSGGVMLPNHAPLAIAEQFGTLEALFGPRIDLGIGRAPGSDQVATHALRRLRGGNAAEDFPRELAELRAYFTGGFPDDHPYAAITATPGYGAAPEIWLLGSSTYSAQLAAILGLPFAFARHFAPQATMPAMAAYRDNFRPSEYLDRPHAMITVTVFAGPDDATAQYLSGPQHVAMARLRTGNPGRYLPSAEAAEVRLDPLALGALQPSSSAWIIGGPDTVRDGLQSVVEMTGADGVMISSMVAEQDARLESHRLIAEAMSDVTVGSAAR